MPETTYGAATKKRIAKASANAMMTETKSARLEDFFIGADELGEEIAGFEELGEFEVSDDEASCITGSDM